MSALLISRYFACSHYPVSYTHLDVYKRQPVAVITESISRALFGSTEAAGKEFLLNHAPDRVVGVVKDVSTLADASYGLSLIHISQTRISLIWLMIYSILWYVRGIHLKNFLKNLISVNAS